MDYEEFFGEGKNEINQIAIAFMKRVKQITGKDVIVYSNLNNVKNTFDDEVAKEGRLWLAYYGNTQNLINVKSSWSTYIGLQYTSTGKVPGINGYVDRDRFSKEIFMKDVQYPDDTGETSDGTIINYVVKPGDTLSQIALTYGTTVNEIARINNIKNVNLIFPGQILEIITNFTQEQENNISKISYIVKKGDTLWAISRKYGVTIQNIVNWNNIKNPNLIYVGNTINIYINSSNNGSESLIRYTVKRGDCLWNIARKYGTAVRNIVLNNGIKNSNLIYPGQVLIIN